MLNSKVYSAGQERIENDQMKLKVLDLSDLAAIQSVSIAIQDQVDEIKNRSIVESTAMGTAYAKWLGAPALGAEFKNIIDNVKTGSQSERWESMSSAIDLIKKVKDAKYYSEGHSSTVVK